MSVQLRGHCPIYDLSTANLNATWDLTYAGKRNAVKSGSTVDLIHDFKLPSNITHLRQSADESTIFAVGGYPHQVKLFSTIALSEQTEHRLNAPATDISMISGDAKKFVISMENRTIQFFCSSGSVATVKTSALPLQLNADLNSATLYCLCPTDMLLFDMELGCFNPSRVLNGFHHTSTFCLHPQASNIALIGGSSDSVPSYTESEINPPVMSGLFSNIFKTQSVVTTLNTVSSETAKLQAAVTKALLPKSNGVNGKLALVDLRQPESSDVSTTLRSSPITALAWDPTGRYYALGNECGTVTLYDCRSSVPIAEHAHNNDASIIKLIFPLNTTLLNSSNSLLSADCYGIKLWEWNNQTLTAAWDVAKRANGSRVKINDLLWWQTPNTTSGLFMAATEDGRPRNFFAPSLGPAPQWCASVEDMKSLTIASQQLENNDNSRYVFVTRDKLKELNAERLIGSRISRKGEPIIKPYMNGFILARDVHEKLLLKHKPFNYDAEIVKDINLELDKAGEWNVGNNKSVNDGASNSLKKHLIKKAFADKLDCIEESDSEDDADARIKIRENIPTKIAKFNRTNAATSALVDSRFSSFLNDPDFAV